MRCRGNWRRTKENEPKSGDYRTCRKRHDSGGQSVKRHITAPAKSELISMFGQMTAHFLRFGWLRLNWTSWRVHDTSWFVDGPVRSRNQNVGSRPLWQARQQLVTLAVGLSKDLTWVTQPKVHLSSVSLAESWLANSCELAFCQSITHGIEEVRVKNNVWSSYACDEILRAYLDRTTNELSTNRQKFVVENFVTAN